VVKSSVMVLPPDQTVTFKAVVNCGFPCLQKILAVVVHIKTKINVVFPDSRMAYGAISRVVCQVTCMFLSVKGSRWSKFWGLDPMVVFRIVRIATDVCSLLVTWVMGNRVGGRWKWRGRSRTMRHGVGVELYLVLLLGGVTDRQVFVEFRFWNCSFL
jgi:hypothetical protein